MVPFMREFTIPPNWTDLVQLISQRVAPENIDLRDTWFIPYIEEDSRKISSRNLGVTPENNNKTLTLPQFEPHSQESLSSEGSPDS